MLLYLDLIWKGETREEGTEEEIAEQEEIAGQLASEVDRGDESEIGRRYRRSGPGSRSRATAPGTLVRNIANY